MNEDILTLMDTRDKYKSMFNRFRLDYFFERYKSLKNEVNHKIRRAKIAEFNESINDKIKDSKRFHSALKKHDVVNSKKSDVSLPAGHLERDLLCQS